MSRYKLQLISENSQEWNLPHFAYVGKDTQNAISIDAPDIERRHALFEVRSGRLFIKSLSAAHPVQINQVALIEAQLSDGDIIRFGSAELIVHDLNQTQVQFACQSLNASWQQKLKLLASVSQTQFPVLLLGPSGTGKDIIAQSIHQASTRKAAAFLSVNCSALTETLIESELFGHVKGSFTGAIHDRKGAFEAARHGTLFLDEIGDLPYSLQAKLLRALENNEIRPVGSDRILRTDVRIIAATHQNLLEKIQEGSFRADLYYRLNVVTVQVPRLQDRMEDFETLLYSFAKQMRVRFSHQAILDLKKHDWPGNIRELKNIVARASALYPKENITPEKLNDLMYPLQAEKKEIWNSDKINTAQKFPQMSVIKEIEKQMILKRLVANKGNQKKTALDLGMPKSTLHDRIKTYQISLPN